MIDGATGEGGRTGTEGPFSKPRDHEAGVHPLGATRAPSLVKSSVVGQSSDQREVVEFRRGIV